MSVSPFVSRHIGPRKNDADEMLHTMKIGSMEELIGQTVPSSIRLPADSMIFKGGWSESEFLEKIHQLASKNTLFKTYIGMGYYSTHTPAVIIRNILENPVWYTSYTPYQAEISQGRLEALLNFQTVITELTGLPIANASLLDEATAAAEAMIMMYNTRSREQEKNNINTLLADEQLWPQTKAVIETRASGLGIIIEYAALKEDPDLKGEYFGVILQYPDAVGEIFNYANWVETFHSKGAKVAVATDLLALTLITPPGEWGADIAFGTSQRFGVPMAYGGPHAAFFATRDEFKRSIPGRIIGVSKDANGKRALRMALQTREQHIKRERATSNICTAQALLATMAGFYAAYHGSQGLTEIARRIHHLTVSLYKGLKALGLASVTDSFFDTVRFHLPGNIPTEMLRREALKSEVNLLYSGFFEFGISLDETTTQADVEEIIRLVASCLNKDEPKLNISEEEMIPSSLIRTSLFLTQEVFHRYHSETEMMRYMKRLERKDISLAHSMISLGSCTMKLNAAAEMFPITWPQFSQLHPFVPMEQAEGYHEMMDELRNDLGVITGLPAVSLQPNSGAAGEYAGLMVIRAWHESRNDQHRTIVLIPSSAHGTNPASAVMAGLEVVMVKCDERGNIDLEDLKAKAEMHRDELSCIMVTYPSTHGVFEESIREICEITHNCGGQVYMDGANMNAQVGLTNPGFIGADVCHLNLHKTFAIPHGGGGPGVGPICVAAHLEEFLPGHPVMDNRRHPVLSVSGAAWGSAGVLPITYGYIKMMGAEGLTMASKMAILNANYMAHELNEGYGVLYAGENGRVGHELIVECRHFKNSSGITETDIAKRLMDYGFHAPTVSFPVTGTLMVEPTESESKAEMDRFIEAMKSILDEIREVETGIVDKLDNVLTNAPHPDYVVVSDEWNKPYSREKAAFPLPWVKENKFWLTVGRVDSAFGDRNLVCTCGGVEDYV
ncbi:MAG TPA: aminomethyl-transferring glycine dehydrogenase [Marinilabiliaceae bacterium]|nr:aminomethyl-transferring glycine dehydrogenase [Marinilabiliaceae bacterium]